MSDLPVIPQSLRISDPKTGTVTPEFLKLLRDLIRENEALKTRVTALETP